MKNLSEALIEALPSPALLGGKEINRERLDKNLQSSMISLRRTWLINVIAGSLSLIILFMFCIYYREDATALKIFLAAMGINFAGVLALLNKTASEMARVSLLLSIVHEVKRETLDELARSLVKKMA